MMPSLPSFSVAEQALSRISKNKSFTYRACVISISSCIVSNWTRIRVTSSEVSPILWTVLWHWTIKLVSQNSRWLRVGVGVLRSQRQLSLDRNDTDNMPMWAPSNTDFMASSRTKYIYKITPRCRLTSQCVIPYHTSNTQIASTHFALSPSRLVGHTRKPSAENWRSLRRN